MIGFNIEFYVFKTVGLEKRYQYEGRYMQMRRDMEMELIV